MSATEAKPEAVPAEEKQIPAGANVTVVPKHQKQAKERLLKLGLKQVKSVSRVTFKKKGNFILAIENPEVYKIQGGSYVVFGEAKVEDLNKRYAETLAAQKAAQKAADDGKNAAEDISTSGSVADAITEDLKKASLEDKKDEDKEEEVADDDVDTTGLDEADIKVVMDQANVSKAKAVSALRKEKGDVVNTIMSLADI